MFAISSISCLLLQFFGNGTSGRSHCWPVVAPTELQVRFKITFPKAVLPNSRELLQTRTLEWQNRSSSLFIFISFLCLPQPASHRSSHWTLCMFYIFPSPLSCSTAKLQNSDSTRCKKGKKPKTKNNQTLSWVQSLCYHALVIPSSRHPQPACFLPLCRWFLLGPNSGGMLLRGSHSHSISFYTSKYLEDCPLGRMYGISCPGSNGHGWNLLKEIMKELRPENQGIF